jgi:hypothetical protein
VFGPATPHDPDPAGAKTAQHPVLALAAGSASVVDGLGPRVLAGGDEHPPVDHVPQPSIGGVAEPGWVGSPRADVEPDGAVSGESLRHVPKVERGGAPEAVNVALWLRRLMAGAPSRTRS